MAKKRLTKSRKSTRKSDKSSEQTSSVENKFSDVESTSLLSNKPDSFARPTNELDEISRKRRVESPNNQNTHAEKRTKTNILNNDRSDAILEHMKQGYGHLKTSDISVKDVKSLYGFLERENFPDILLNYVKNELTGKFIKLIGEGQEFSAELLAIISALLSRNIDKSTFWEECISELGDDRFQNLFKSSLKFIISDCSFPVKSCLLDFVTCCIYKLEIEVVRKQILSITRVAILSHIHPKKIQIILDENKSWKKSWASWIKKYRTAEENKETSLIEAMDFEKDWLHELLCVLDIFHNDQISPENFLQSDGISFLLKIGEFILAILVSPPTRNYANFLIDDHLSALLFLQISKKVKEISKERSILLEKTGNSIMHYEKSYINDLAGEILSNSDRENSTERLIFSLQKSVFHDENLKAQILDFCFLNMSSFKLPGTIRKHLMVLAEEDVIRLADMHGIRTKQLKTELSLSKNDIIMYMECKLSNLTLPQDSFFYTYATEKDLWNETILELRKDPRMIGSILPKLNLQLLSMQDYLFRSYSFSIMESHRILVEYVENLVSAMQPAPSLKKENNWTIFGGESDSAISISGISVSYVGKNKIDEKIPSKVLADISLSFTDLEERKKWLLMNPGDIFYLVSIKARRTGPQEIWENSYNGTDSKGRTAKEFFNIQTIRGCELVEVLSNSFNLKVDEFGKPLIYEAYREQNINEHYKPNIIFRVSLDQKRYLEDVASMKIEDSSEESITMFSSFNLLVRGPKTLDWCKSGLEKFKSSLLYPEERQIVPLWLENALLGHFNIENCQYPYVMRNLNQDSRSNTIELNGSFQDLEQVSSLISEDFQEFKIKSEFRELNDNIQDVLDNFNSSSLISEEKSLKRKFRVSFHYELGEDKLTPKDCTIQEVGIAYRGPFEDSAFYFEKSANILSSLAKARAVIRGCLPGITMTEGSIDSMVINNIVSNLVNKPSPGRVMVIARSKNCLNKVFSEFLKNTDVNESSIIRLDRESNWESDPYWSRWTPGGTLRWYEGRRQVLLNFSGRLSVSLGKDDGISRSCESANSFFYYQLIPLWQDFQSFMADSDNVNDLFRQFPFSNFFSDNSEKFSQFLKKNPSNLNLSSAKIFFIGCWTYLEEMFSEIQSLRSLEVLYSSYDKYRYLCTKHSKVVFSTFEGFFDYQNLAQGLQISYDSIIILEGEKFSETETLIPLILTRSSSNDFSLQRIILMASEENNEEEYKTPNTFGRLKKLGVPCIKLD